MQGKDMGMSPWEVEMRNRMGWRSGLRPLFLSNGREYWVLAVLSFGSTEHWQYYFSLDTIYKCITSIPHGLLSWLLQLILENAIKKNWIRDCHLTCWEGWFPHMVTGQSVTLPHHSRDILARMPTEQEVEFRAYQALAPRFAAIIVIMLS